MHKRFVVLQHRVFKIDGDHCVESHMNATIQDRCISGKMAANCHARGCFLSRDCFKY